VNRRVAALLALAAAGLLLFAVLGAAVDGSRLLPLDRDALSVADHLHSEPFEDVLVWVTALGSLAVTGPVVLAAAVWAASERRAAAIALPVAFLITWGTVQYAKAAFGRPRPPDPHVVVESMAFPSGHAANGVAWVAAALVLARSGYGGRAMIGAAVVLALVIAATRVLLRAHYLSDVVGGLALAGAVYAIALAVGPLRQDTKPRP
jgi:undecaprenyl-diphosphatase